MNPFTSEPAHRNRKIKLQTDEVIFRGRTIKGFRVNEAEFYPLEVLQHMNISSWPIEILNAIVGHLQYPTPAFAKIIKDISAHAFQPCPTDEEAAERRGKVLELFYQERMLNEKHVPALSFYL